MIDRNRSNAPRPDEGDEDVVDVDFVAVAKYMDGALSLEQASAVEDRAEHDDAFWYKVGPVVDLLALLGSAPAAIDLGARAKRARAKPRSVQLVTQDRTEPAGGSTLPIVYGAPTLPVRVVEPDRAIVPISSRRTFVQRWVPSTRVAKTVAAAGVVGVAISAAALIQSALIQSTMIGALFHPHAMIGTKGMVHDTGQTGRDSGTTGHDTTTARKDSTKAGGVPMKRGHDSTKAGAVSTAATHDSTTAGAASTVAPQHAIKPLEDTTDFAHQYMRDFRAGRAIVGGLGVFVQDTTGAGETRVVMFGSNTIVLRPNSRIAWRMPQGMVYGLGDSLAPTDHFTVDGDVVFTTFQSWRIVTKWADIEVESGVYAIRSIPNSGEVRLSVGAGLAMVTPSGANRAKTQVERGDYVRIAQVGAVVISHDSTGFPRFGGDSVTPTKGTTGGVKPPGGGR